MYDWHKTVHKTVQSIIDEIDRCIKENCGESLTLSILSRKFGYSEYHFSRMFKEISGMRLRDYMRYRRLAFALKRVRDTDEGLLDSHSTAAFPHTRRSQELSRKHTVSRRTVSAKIPVPSYSAQ